MTTLPEKLRNLFPNYKDSPEKKFFKIAIILIFAAVIVMILAAVVTFVLSLKGPTEVLVPDVVMEGEERADLIAAVQRLQAKGLIAWIQMKPSSLYARGIVIEQRPGPGSVVKAGRNIMLTVSSGSVIRNIGDYVGKTLASVNLELQELFSSDVAPLVQIREPVMYVYDELPAETILAQSPAPGTAVRESEVMYLEFVVSKGPRGEVFELPDLRGRAFLEVMTEIAEERLLFVFESRPAEAGEARGVIVDQALEPGEELEEGDAIALTMTDPEVPESSEFGVFTIELPQYPFTVLIELYSESDEETNLIFAMQHTGGLITIPYVKPRDSRLVFMVQGEVVSK